MKLAKVIRVLKRRQQYLRDNVLRHPQTNEFVHAEVAALEKAINIMAAILGESASGNEDEVQRNNSQASLD